MAISVFRAACSEEDISYLQLWKAGPKDGTIKAVGTGQYLSKSELGELVITWCGSLSEEDQKFEFPKRLYLRGSQ